MLSLSIKFFPPNSMGPTAALKSSIKAVTVIFVPLSKCAISFVVVRFPILVFISERASVTLSYIPPPAAKIAFEPRKSKSPIALSNVLTAVVKFRLSSLKLSKKLVPFQFTLPVLEYTWLTGAAALEFADQSPAWTFLITVPPIPSNVMEVLLVLASYCTAESF